MSDSDTARAVGINHVALDVGDIEDALDCYRSVFDVRLRGRSDGAAFIDMGDQFLALSESDDAGKGPDGHRHVGLVVDDLDAVEHRLDEADVEPVPGQEPDFRDPWGNYFQLVAYADVQFTKADHVLRGMGLEDLEKSDDAIEELRAKGLAPE